ncbi:MAG: hypothetical protein M3R24_06905 [Chloroflexota bacterium]|nr:hypothetical protein [Chloroflexota bacterium]
MSVDDILHAQQGDPESFDAAIGKVRSAIRRWTSILARRAGSGDDWISNMLLQYATAELNAPALSEADSRKEISIPLTLEPSFGYSVRQPLSDGWMTRKTQVTTTRTPTTPFLTVIGATRFLRAHRVANNLVNLYVPYGASVTICGDTTLPVLRFMDVSSDQALALHALHASKTTSASTNRWEGIAYQVLQTQGVQQAISRGRGRIDTTWLQRIQEAAGVEAIDYWSRLLAARQGDVPFELDDLVDLVLKRRSEALLSHAKATTLNIQRATNFSVREYTVHELKEVTRHMLDTKVLPLSSLLDRKEGTLRFGQALRQIGRIHPPDLRDLIDVLDSVYTRDQLVWVLGDIVQVCMLSQAKSSFAVVPNDQDLKHLLDDIDQYGARMIAGFLIVLSGLRYGASTTNGEQSPVDARDRSTE